MLDSNTLLSMTQQDTLDNIKVSKHVVFFCVCFFPNLHVHLNAKHTCTCKYYTSVHVCFFVFFNAL